MNKFLRILRLIFETIVAPFNVIIKSNGIGLESNKWTKAWIIFIVESLIIFLLLLYYYKDYFYNLGK